MDMRTGRLYDSWEEAVASGVPVSDIAEIVAPIDQVKMRLAAGLPVVKFSKGSFKNMRRNAAGELERV